jgi:hypothetical protein
MEPFAIWFGRKAGRVPALHDEAGLQAIARLFGGVSGCAGAERLRKALSGQRMRSGLGKRLISAERDGYGAGGDDTEG